MVKNKKKRNYWNLKYVAFSFLKKEYPINIVVNVETTDPITKHTNIVISHC